jgi:hypothetical protein
MWSKECNHGFSIQFFKSFDGFEVLVLGKVEGGLLLLEKGLGIEGRWKASEAKCLVEVFELIVDVGLLLW